MTNAFLLIGIIFQAVLVIALAWCIWNEKKVIVFERNLVREIKLRRQKKLREKRKAAIKAAAKDISKEVYYTPVKPVKRRTASSFDAA